MTQTLNFAVKVTLRDQAADALRRARRLPVGAARNDLRQLAIGLRCLDLRQQQEMPTRLMNVAPGEAPLAPL